MKFGYFFALLCIYQISARKIPDPFKKLESLVGKVAHSADNVGQGILDSVSPVIKEVGKVDTALTGGLNGTLNKDIFKVVKGTTLGLAEVVGDPVKLKDVNFFLATGKNVKNATKVDYHNPADVAISNGKFFFIIHGWTDSVNSSWIQNLTEVLLIRHPDSHVVQVDWSKPAGDQYPFSAFYTESVGEIVANFLLNLHKNHSVSTEKIVLIGHSLGAQTCGWTGKKFRKLSGITLPLIVGLDPAGPLFCLRPESKRLTKTDAERVMVIHTDGGILGMLEACGTVDFFPNGGSDQPGCDKVNVVDLHSLLNPLSCSHARSHDYLIEALNSTKAFASKKCDSFLNFMMNSGCDNVETYMGLLFEKNVGAFYLKTASKKPFSLEWKSSMTF